MEEKDLIDRRRVLKILNTRIKQEEKKLTSAKTEYRKRLYSYRLATLRDLYDSVRLMPN
ncbi:MAG: hypothetical protein V8Q71_00150 [Bacilli bacterium]